MVALLLRYKRLGTSGKQQFKLSEALESYLALKAFLRLLISITFLNHLCSLNRLQNGDKDNSKCDKQCAILFPDHKRPDTYLTISPTTCSE